MMRVRLPSWGTLRHIGRGWGGDGRPGRSRCAPTQQGLNAGLEHCQWAGHRSGEEATCSPCSSSSSNRRDQSGASAMAQAPRAAPCKHPRQRQQAPQTAAAAGGAPSHAFYVCTCAWCAAVAGTTPQPSPAGSPAENNSSWWRCLERPSAGCSPAQASSAAALATRASSTTTRRGMEGLRTWLSHHHCPSRQAGSAGHAGNIHSQPPLCPHVCMYHVPTNATAMHA